MPKDQFDPQDPMEFTSVGLATTEDTLEPMAEAFVEEFMWLGYDPERIFALFRQPVYAGMHVIYQARGADFVRQLIARVFAAWSGSNPSPPTTQAFKETPQ
ncbi:MAG: hypothetical protein HY360_23150 [Verrucomicrobia bacterium]|nr:hypothetical protein [Verrucomicrobiota bacterium]